MTAFSRTQHSNQGFEWVWELRSVNHRFFEIVFRLPEAFREHEHRWRERARQRLSRGRIEASLKWVNSTRDLHLNEPAVEALLSTLTHLQSKHRALTAPSGLEILQWPGVLAEAQADREFLLDGVQRAFDEALALLDHEREREGTALCAAIAERLQLISSTVDELKRETSHLSETLQARMLARVSELKVEVDAARLAQEVALLALRADVQEELDRLTTHVGEMNRIIQSTGPSGRRLDFLTQELHREANTLSAKSISSVVTNSAVSLKVAIEQIREQVQNVE